MAGDGPNETASTNPLGALLASSTAVGIILGIFGGIVGTPVTRGVLGVGSTVGSAVAFLATFGVVVGLAVLARVGQEVRFYDDRVAVTGGLLGIGGGSAQYDELELVVRKRTLGDRAFGTATFEALRYDDNLVVRYVSDPDTVERVLGERLAPPTEQLRAARKGHPRTYFWDKWSDDHDLPEGPVVDAEELGRILDVDLGDVDLDALDEAENLVAFDDLTDLDDVAGEYGDTGGFEDGEAGDVGGDE